MKLDRILHSATVSLSSNVSIHADLNRDTDSINLNNKLHVFMEEAAYMSSLHDSLFLQQAPIQRRTMLHCAISSPRPAT